MLVGNGKGGENNPVSRVFRDKTSDVLILSSVLKPVRIARMLVMSFVVGICGVVIP